MSQFFELIEHTVFLIYREYELNRISKNLDKYIKKSEKLLSLKNNIYKMLCNYNTNYEDIFDVDKWK